MRNDHWFISITLEWYWIKYFKNSYLFWIKTVGWVRMKSLSVNLGNILGLTRTRRYNLSMRSRDRLGGFRRHRGRTFVVGRGAMAAFPLRGGWSRSVLGGWGGWSRSVLRSWGRRTDCWGLGGRGADWRGGSTLGVNLSNLFSDLLIIIFFILILFLLILFLILRFRALSLK